MKKAQAVFLTLFVALALKASAQGNAPLKLISSTPLPGFTGDFDHFGIDLNGGRLFLAAEDHKTVEVFDLHTGKRLHSITGFSQPHAIHYIPESNELIVTDGDDFGMCELVSGKTYKILRTIKLPVGVDSGEYNPVDQDY
ncbi:MAG: YncE family protein, partial [Terriglobia bacterium]